MKVSIFVITFLLICTFGFSENRRLSDGLTNGRQWLTCNKEAKIMYVAAMGDFLAYHSSKKNMEVNKKGSMEKRDLGAYMLSFVPYNHTFDELVKQLDNFYTDSTNSTIPIIVAMRIVAQKFYGTSEGTLKAMTEAARSGDYLMLDDDLLVFFEEEK